MKVEYAVSSRLDMAVTNWNDGVGNFAYYYLLVLMGDANCDGILDAFDIDPFVAALTGV